MHHLHTDLQLVHVQRSMTVRSVTSFYTYMYCICHKPRPPKKLVSPNAYMYKMHVRVPALYNRHKSMLIQRLDHVFT